MNHAEEKTSQSGILRSPEAVLIGAFAGLILIGTFLLMLPFSHIPGNVGFLEALFTATSAVCVTGLIVVDTATDFTGFGQLVILILIQLGGLGILTFAAMFFQLLGKRLSLNSQAQLQDIFLQKKAASEFKSIFKKILLITFGIEAVGTTALCIFLIPQMRIGQAIFYSAFHSVSAFCNAGFALYTDSLVGLRSHFGIMTVISLLIILGGIGHPVLLEVGGKIMNRVFQRETDKRQKLSLHSRVVIRMSLILILVGFLGLLYMGLTDGEKGVESKIGNALFQSITARTAGFNSVDIGALPEASIFLIVLLMFIGGSPGSCAGGLKTTTVAIWFARLRAVAKGQSETTLMGRAIPEELVYRIIMLFGLALLWNTVGVLLLLHTESAAGVGMHDIFFEQVSAFGTVGLSTGLTPKLTAVGRIWIIMSMFVGRLGPLTFAAWAITSNKKVKVRHPEGRVMIG